MGSEIFSGNDKICIERENVPIKEPKYINEYKDSLNIFFRINLCFSFIIKRR